MFTNCMKKIVQQELTITQVYMNMFRGYFLFISETKQGKLPMLTVDGGKVIAQSSAMCRYIAREFGMYSCVCSLMDMSQFYKYLNWSLHYQDSMHGHLVMLSLTILLLCHILIYKTHQPYAIHSSSKNISKSGQI